MQIIERLLIKIGILLIVVGFIFFLFRKIGMPFGKLPGDIHISRDGFEMWIPITTCLIISGLITVILWLINYLSNHIK
ncbi:MAG: DUF2905 domain-containing protein [Thermotogota bacterium]|nr:DUF2905 domain-containing protein [Thermotogota bacterium]